MEPSTFYQIQISDLALRLPLWHTDAIAVQDALRSTNCRCHAKIKLNDGNFKTAPLAIISNRPGPGGWYREPTGSEVVFTLNSLEFRHLKRKPVKLTIDIFASFEKHPVSGLASPPDWSLGCVSVILDFTGSGCIEDDEHFSGWREASMNGKTYVDMHYTIATRIDERFVLKFTSDPECNPKVMFNTSDLKSFPIYTCSFAHGIGRETLRSRKCAKTDGLKEWFRKQFSTGEKGRHEKKGRHDWSIVMYDQSGVPIAGAMMVKPFIPNRTGHVAVDQPGSWLISLRTKTQNSLVPWGKLDVFQNISTGQIEYKFKWVSNRLGRIQIPTFNSNISAKKGGVYSLNLQPHGGLGFIMSAIIEEGRHSCPLIEVAAKYINNAEELAAYAALAAAVDLCVDACQPFNVPLRKELREP